MKYKIKWINGSGGEEQALFSTKEEAEKYGQFVWNRGFRVFPKMEEIAELGDRNYSSNHSINADGFCNMGCC